MTSSRSEFIAGAKAEMPILLGVIPFGLIYGVLASGAGLPASLAQAMSCIVFAGSAQFIAAQLIGTGTPALVLILTTLVVNLRHMLYSASVAPYIKHLRPQWKWLLAYLLTDEAYAVTILHYQETDDTSLAHKHWFFLGAGLALWSTWQVSTGVGIFVGAQVPASWSLDFTLALTFIALVVPALKDRAGWVAALVGGTVAVLAAGLPFKLGLILAALTGILAGLGAERFAISPTSLASSASLDDRGAP
jgi:4-azaleucine resistance transporter AzlC